MRKKQLKKKKTEKRRQRADPARSLVVTSRSASVQRRMLGAAVLKGTGMAFYEGRPSGLGHSLVPQTQSGPGVTAQHDSCQEGRPWLCVRDRTVRQRGFAQPLGGECEMFGKEELNRSPVWSQQGWLGWACGKDGSDGRKTSLSLLTGGFHLKMASERRWI